MYLILSLQYDIQDGNLLLNVKTVKVFRAFCLNYVIVHADHKYLTIFNKCYACVLHKQLIKKEFGPELNFINGVSNVIANALGQVPNENNLTPKYLK